jgi:hypothetical protein
VPALADAAREPVAGIEVTSQRADKTEERSWVTYWHPLRDPQGEIIGANVAAEEVTDAIAPKRCSPLTARLGRTLPLRGKDGTYRLRPRPIDRPAPVLRRYRSETGTRDLEEHSDFTLKLTLTLGENLPT